jgi:hypothetical protein
MAAMTAMERPHVMLLELLVRYEPDAVMGVGWKAVPQRSPSYVSKFMGGAGPPFFWSVGRRVWTLAQIRDARPSLAPALTGLLATLQSFGLIQGKDTGPETAKRLGDELAKQINRQAGQN